jgi:hypothetical protein
LTTTVFGTLVFGTSVEFVGELYTIKSYKNRIHSPNLLKMPAVEKRSATEILGNFPDGTEIPKPTSSSSTESPPAKRRRCISDDKKSGGSEEEVDGAKSEQQRGNNREANRGSNEIAVNSTTAEEKGIFSKLFGFFFNRDESSKGSSKSSKDSKGVKTDVVSKTAADVSVGRSGKISGGASDRSFGRLLSLPEDLIWRIDAYANLHAFVAASGNAAFQKKLRDWRFEESLHYRAVDPVNTFGVIIADDHSSHFHINVQLTRTSDCDWFDFWRSWDIGADALRWSDETQTWVEGLERPLGKSSYTPERSLSVDSDSGEADTAEANANTVTDSPTSDSVARSSNDGSTENDVNDDNNDNAGPTGAARTSQPASKSGVKYRRSWYIDSDSSGVMAYVDQMLSSELEPDRGTSSWLLRPNIIDTEDSKKSESEESDPKKSTKSAFPSCASMGVRSVLAGILVPEWIALRKFPNTMDKEEDWNFEGLLSSPQIGQKIRDHKELEAKKFHTRHKDQLQHMRSMIENWLWQRSIEDEPDPRHGGHKEECDENTGVVALEVHEDWDDRRPLESKRTNSERGCRRVILLESRKECLVLDVCITQRLNPRAKIPGANADADADAD